MEHERRRSAARKAVIEDFKRAMNTKTIYGYIVYWGKQV